jgi:hypothetical protein
MIVRTLDIESHLHVSIPSSSAKKYTMDIDLLSLTKCDSEVLEKIVNFTADNGVETRRLFLKKDRFNLGFREYPLKIVMDYPVPILKRGKQLVAEETINLGKMIVSVGLVAKIISNAYLEVFENFEKYGVAEHSLDGMNMEIVLIDFESMNIWPVFSQS